MDYRDVVIRELADSEACLIEHLADQTVQAFTYKALTDQFLRELVLVRVAYRELEDQLCALMGVREDNPVEELAD